MTAKKLRWVQETTQRMAISWWCEWRCRTPSDRVWKWSGTFVAHISFRIGFAMGWLDSLAEGWRPPVKGKVAVVSVVADNARSCRITTLSRPVPASSSSAAVASFARRPPYSLLPEKKYGTTFFLRIKNANNDVHGSPLLHHFALKPFFWKRFFQSKFLEVLVEMNELGRHQK